MDAVMTAPTTRHHLLTPAASLARSKHPKKPTTSASSLPISVPTRKSDLTPHAHPSRRLRDPSPDMLFDMSPPADDAPVHYYSFSIGPAPAPTPAQNPPLSKNRLALVDTSVHSALKSKLTPTQPSTHEPFLYSFPVLAGRPAPGPRPGHQNRLPNDPRTRAHPQPKTPSPPFGKTQTPTPRPTPPTLLTGAFRTPASPDSPSDGSFSDSTSSANTTASSPSVPKDPWSSQLKAAPAPPPTLFGSSALPHELERGRQRAPKHRRS